MLIDILLIFEDYISLDGSYGSYLILSQLINKIRLSNMINLKTKKKSIQSQLLNSFNSVRITLLKRHCLL